MARVRSRDTEPERRLRKLLTERGVRYRLHLGDLPGKPDIYVGRLRLVIFVNGCFWHGHDCRRGRLPTTNREFWENKIRRNMERDREVRGMLLERGINVMVLWTCPPDVYEAAAHEIAESYHKART